MYLNRSKQILYYFCASNRSINSQIIKAASSKDIERIVQKYHHSFNLFNITALLKKVSRIKLFEDQSNERVFIEVRKHLEKIIIPNVDNARALANIIGYTGNLNYHGLDDLLRKIDYEGLF